MTSTITETVRNGVDIATLFATLDAIKAQPEIAAFRFRAHNKWIDGAHNPNTIKDFYAACGEDTTRAESFELNAGEPEILLGVPPGSPDNVGGLPGPAMTSLSMVHAPASRIGRPAP
jgi:hypothetical protein